MIAATLYGRLGNNCYQIATCIATALRNKTDFMIPNRSINPKEWKPYFINLSPQRITSGLPIYKEPSFCYTPIPNKNQMRTDGYFQSFKYFDDYRADVIRVMGFKWELNKGVVGVHVRRGDYAKYPDKHPMLPVSYYDAAIRYFCDNYGFNHFKFFSDDIDWCKLNFMTKDFIKTTPLDIKFSFSEGKTELQDMTELSCCEHQIVANSSFSLFAAWLNRNPDKIVIAPHKDQYFGIGNAHLDTRDLIPDSWIQMKY